jgi:hypothetical protein
MARVSDRASPKTMKTSASQRRAEALAEQATVRLI